ncbi:NAD(P)/FAD-dependent oxidoreductase [Streptomyces sp. NPDC058683]|uniref:NAD(P)/FAD-dependent oxidoreductase n=1 Tax=Streptomyces sp. NPDC058683 TaxID=3346597 RepID=UPI00366443FD
MAHKVVVVGSSVAGIRTAQALTAEADADVAVTVIGEEAEWPYDRPPLSKQILAGAWDRERIALLGEADATAAGIELRLGVAAAGLDTTARRVKLADGSVVGYDTLVIATGLSARPSPWRPESGVHLLRTLADSTNLKQHLLPGSSVVVIGGGFIGAEAAAAARTAGCEVTVVDPVAVPMARVAGPVLGGLLSQVHARHGVDARFGVGVRSVTGAAGDLTVALDDGTRLRAATVVVGIGATPNVGWLADSGLTIDDGVVCDEYLAAVGAPGVYAVGDVARWPHPVLGTLVRSEHWTNAIDQARCAALNITHPDARVPYQPSDYVWSDQYDWKLQLIGRPLDGGQEALVGDLEAQRPRAALLHTDAAGRLCAAAVVNWPKALLQCRRMIAEGASLDQARERLAAPPRT